MAKQTVRKIVSLDVSYTKDVKTSEPSAWSVGKDGVLSIQDAPEYFVIWHEGSVAEVLNRGIISRFKFKTEETEIEVPDAPQETEPVQVQA